MGPCFAILLVGLALGAGSSPYYFIPLIFLSGAALYKGADIIDQPFLRYSAIAGHHQINDEQGNENAFGATYLITEITDVVGNSAVLTFHKVTKFNTTSNVDKRRVTARGVNFYMEDIGNFFKKGNGELFGFDFATNHIAPMLIREDPTEQITDAKGTRATIHLTSLKVIDDEVKEKIERESKARIKK